MRPMPSKRASTAMALAAVATVALAAGGASLAAPDASVTVKDFNFHPAAITVPVGTTVVWKNLDGEPHTVTSVDGTFRSEALDQGDSYKFKFSKPGVYRYRCTIHPRMKGAVTVK
jgi:plastocyanin